MELFEGYFTDREELRYALSASPEFMCWSVCKRMPMPWTQIKFFLQTIRHIERLNGQLFLVRQIFIPAHCRIVELCVPPYIYSVSLAHL
jgi:hypothetical protein